MLIITIIIYNKASTRNLVPGHGITPGGGVEPIIHFDRTQQLRFSRIDPSLETFDHIRFLPSGHELITRKQRKYKYYQHLFAVARVKKEPLSNRGKTSKRVSNL